MIVAILLFQVGEVLDDPARPPCMTVFAPGETVEPEFTIPPQARGFVDVWVNGASEPVRLEAVGSGRVRAKLPAGKDGDVLEYRTVVERNGREECGPRRVVFISRSPTSAERIPESPPPYKRMTPSPVDWRDRAIYFVVTDRFFDGDPTNNRLGYAGAAHGGDFRGLAQKLDYIRDLGFTAIWITPVVQNFETYHGYAAVNFLLPDRRLGTLAELREFVDAAHARGIAVLLDVVVNHTADLLDPVDGGSDYREEGRAYEFRYRKNGEKVLPLPIEFRDPTRYHAYGDIDRWDDYAAHPSHTQTGHFFGLDDLKTEDPAVRRALIRIYRWWIAETDVDGFRVDTVKHVEPGFWKEFCPAIRDYAASIGKKNFFLLAEFYRGVDEDVAPVTRGGQFDGVLHFPMYDTITEVFRKGAAADRIFARMEKASLYRDDSLNALFLDNHDVPRFLHDADVPRLKAALAFLFTARGVPCVYYGTEQGFRGGGDPENREDMKFDSTHELKHWITTLNRLRRELEPLRRGAFVPRQDKELFVFSRKTEREEVVVAINLSANARSEVPGWGVRIYRKR